jgi:hypothetical protein
MATTVTLEWWEQMRVISLHRVRQDAWKATRAGFLVLRSLLSGYKYNDGPHVTAWSEQLRTCLENATTSTTSAETDFNIGMPVRSTDVS